MIKLRITSGRHEGQASTSQEIAQKGIDPVALLGEMATSGSQWELDAAEGTEDEILEWGKADLVGRVIAAAINNRTVRFMGQRWDFTNIDFGSNRSIETIGQIEDAIAESGRMVMVLNDDWEDDLVIGVDGYEETQEP